MKRFLFLLALGAAGAYFFRIYCYEGIYVASGSMEPTLPIDRHVMVKKYAYFFREPKRGEIIMFDSPVDPSKGMIKRVIAISGDVVELREKKVYLNNEKLYEPYVQILHPTIMYVGDNLKPIQVPPGYLFVLGDNRDVSGDSRDWKDANGQHMPLLPLSKVRGLVQ